jgi:DNA-directed RNA polymerase subunit M/transcription elongation factor TFIIS
MWMISTERKVAGWQPGLTVPIGMTGKDDTLRCAVCTLLACETDLTGEQADDLERGILNYAIQRCLAHFWVPSWGNPLFAEMYLDKARSMVSQLWKGSGMRDDKLVADIQCGRLVPHELPGLRPHELRPDLWAELVARKLERDAQAYSQRLVSKTDQFKCGRCKKRECVYHEMQCRSADEGTSVFVTCISCGHRWRIG